MKRFQNRFTLPELIAMDEKSRLEGNMLTAEESRAMLARRRGKTKIGE